MSKGDNAISTINEEAQLNAPVPPPEGAQIRGDSNTLVNDMRWLINNREFSDVKFIVGKQRKPIFAHRCIIMARSKVFNAMITEQSFKLGRQGFEKPLVLTDIQPHIFLTLLEFIYTNTLRISPSMAFDTIGAAIEYGLEDMRQSIMSYVMKAGTSPQNACEALRIALMFDSEELKQCILNYIIQHTAEVFHDRSFYELSESSLTLLLEYDQLNIDEIDLFKAIREWANVNSVTQSLSPVAVAKHAIIYLRLTLLSPEELSKIEEEDVKKEAMISAEQFSYAWKCHAMQSTTERLRNGTKHRPHHAWITASQPQQTSGNIEKIT